MAASEDKNWTGKLLGALTVGILAFWVRAGFSWVVGSPIPWMEALLVGAAVAGTVVFLSGRNTDEA